MIVPSSGTPISGVMLAVAAPARKGSAAERRHTDASATHRHSSWQEVFTMGFIMEGSKIFGTSPRCTASQKRACRTGGNHGQHERRKDRVQDNDPQTHIPIGFPGFGPVRQSPRNIAMAVDDA